MRSSGFFETKYCIAKATTTTTAAAAAAAVAIVDTVHERAWTLVAHNTRPQQCLLALRASLYSCHILTE